MTPLQELLLERIRTEGPITFAEFMRVALYDPRHGYYSAGPERVGRAGHFLTSPELDPAFGELWSGAFRECWAACGEPERFDVIEVGPGRGSFAAAVLHGVSGPFAAALRYRLIEPLPALRSTQAEAAGETEIVTWHRSLDELAPAPCGCVFLNEVLDNAPVHVVTSRSSELRELRVGERDGSLAWVEASASDARIARYLEGLGMRPGEGHLVEVGLAAQDLARAAARSIERGAVIAVDYGDEAAGLLERPGGTLVSYSATGVDDRVLEDPGGRDITAHVNWSAVAAALRSEGHGVAGPRPQREALRALGLAGVDRALKEAHDAALGAGRGAEAVRLLSRRHAVAALADPGGLGGLQALVGSKGIEGLPFLT